MILTNLLFFDVDDFLDVDNAHKLTAFPLEHHRVRIRVDGDGVRMDDLVGPIFFV
jgi:hypothetical protein